MKVLYLRIKVLFKIKVLYLEKRCYTQNEGVIPGKQRCYIQNKGVIPESKGVIFKIKVLHLKRKVFYSK